MSELNPQEQIQLEKVRASHSEVNNLLVISGRLKSLTERQRLKYDGGRMLQIYLLNKELKESVDRLQKTLL